MVCDAAKRSCLVCVMDAMACSITTLALPQDDGSSAGFRYLTLSPSQLQVARSTASHRGRLNKKSCSPIGWDSAGEATTRDFAARQLRRTNMGPRRSFMPLLKAARAPSGRS
jgi:hypothetical protein